MKLPFACLIAMLATANATPPVPSTAIAHRVRAEYSHSFTVARPIAEAFIFFEPVGEKCWATEWAPVFATPSDAELHDGSVFTAEFPFPHNGGSTSTVWTITRYEAPNVIEYHNVLIGFRATRITIRCESVSAVETRVTVRYVYTGLTDAGDDLLEQMTESRYRSMIDGWSTEIAKYLERGTPASQ